MCSEPTLAIHMCIVLYIYKLGIHMYMCVHIQIGYTYVHCTLYISFTSLPPLLPLYLIFLLTLPAQFREAPRQMKDKVQQLRGEIDEKTSWDSKYCSDIFHRR